MNEEEMLSSCLSMQVDITGEQNIHSINKQLSFKNDSLFLVFCNTQLIWVDSVQLIRWTIYGTTDTHREMNWADQTNENN